VVCRQVGGSGRQTLLAGLLGVAVLVALVGWVGVAWRVTPWALPTQGLWRAASTLTYANATAAFLVPLALVAMALLADRPRSLPIGLTVVALLVGLGATLSRAGGLSLIIGFALMIVTAHRLGWVTIVKPLVGAGVALVGVLPAFPVAASPRPLLAVSALIGGMGLTAVLLRYPRTGRAVVMVAGVLVVGALAVGMIAGLGSLREGFARVWSTRGNLASNRSTAAAPAIRVVAAHPLIGVGPNRADLRWIDEQGRLRVEQYVHDEYLQVLTELGAIGLVLLLALLAAISRLIWKSRTLDGNRALWVGVLAAWAAALVHGGFDFVWHVPAVPLTLAALVGLVQRAVEPAQERRSS
jgi:O-antigen ligase